MKNILPKIRQEKAKMVHWMGELKTTKEERHAIKARYKKLARIENKIINRYF